MIRSLCGGATAPVAPVPSSSQELYTVTTRKPAANGSIDPRLGISNMKDECATCKRKLADCSGHYGYIELALPVYHIGFFKTTIAVLQCVCKTCSRVLVSGKSRKRHLAYMRDPRLDAVRKAKNFKAIIDVCPPPAMPAVS